MKRFAAYFLCALLLVLAGCASHEPAPMDQDTLLKLVTGKKWMLVDAYGREPLEDTGIFILFDEDGKVSGSAGCNNFGGTYSIDGEALVFGPLMSTKKSCGPSLDEQEYFFLNALSQADRIHVEEGELQLISDDHHEPMRFAVEGENSSWLW